MLGDPETQLLCGRQPSTPKTHSHQSRVRTSAVLISPLGSSLNLQGFTSDAWKMMASDDQFTHHLSAFISFYVMNGKPKTLWKHGEARFGASLPMSTMH